MKKIFMTNLYIDQVCLKSVSTESDAQCVVTTFQDPALEVPLKPNRRFEQLLLEAVDEGLSSLGDSSKQALYETLEQVFNISKKEIPGKIEQFANAIEEIFGVGAKLLEIQIMKYLYKRIGETYKYIPKQEDLTFSEYLTAIHTNLW